MDINVEYTLYKLTSTQTDKSTNTFLQVFIFMTLSMLFSAKKKVDIRGYYDDLQRFPTSKILLLGYFLFVFLSHCDISINIYFKYFFCYNDYR